MSFQEDLAAEQEANRNLREENDRLNRTVEQLQRELERATDTAYKATVLNSPRQVQSFDDDDLLIAPPV